MRFNNSTHLIILVCLALFACSDAIDFTPEFKPSLVIFSGLHNETKNFEVMVVRTTPPKSFGRSNRNDPINDASITLYMEDYTADNPEGIKTKITDQFSVNEGKYISRDDISSKLIANNKYWIELTIDGILYRSNKEPLPAALTQLGASYKNNAVAINFLDPPKTKDYYAYSVHIISGGSLNDGRSLYSDDLLFNGQKAHLKYPIFDGITPHDNVGLQIARLSPNTYTFLKKLDLQKSALDGEESEAGGPAQLFSPPPANLTGNIYEVKSGRSVIGSFVVFWGAFFSKTGAEIGVK